MLEIVALFVLAVWLYLLAARGRFWLGRGRERAAAAAAAPAAWPAVVAVIPARDEAATIGQTVQSLLGQDYPGLALIVVDDGSTDGTADVAAKAAAAIGARRPAHACCAASRWPPGWTGKVWAQKQGVDAARGGARRSICC